MYRCPLLHLFMLTELLCLAAAAADGRSEHSMEDGASHNDGASSVNPEVGHLVTGCTPVNWWHTSHRSVRLPTSAWQMVLARDSLPNRPAAAQSSYSCLLLPLQELEMRGKYSEHQRAKRLRKLNALLRSPKAQKSVRTLKR